MPQLLYDCPMRCHKLPQNCHKIATMPHPSKPLKISAATIATNATSKNVYVRI